MKTLLLFTGLMMMTLPLAHAEKLLPLPIPLKVGTYQPVRASDECAPASIDVHDKKSIQVTARMAIGLEVTEGPFEVKTARGCFQATDRTSEFDEVKHETTIIEEITQSCNENQVAVAINRRTWRISASQIHLIEEDQDRHIPLHCDWVLQKK